MFFAILYLYFSGIPLPLSIVAIVLASLCFANSYNGQFVFDDSVAIVNNADVKNAALTNLFYNDFWGTKLSHKQSHRSYRPLTILTFRWEFLLFKKIIVHRIIIILYRQVDRIITIIVNSLILHRFHYWLRGYLEPMDFHLFNIGLHTIVCVLTLFAFNILLDRKAEAFYAALLFAVHPCHTEAVSAFKTVIACWKVSDYFWKLNKLYL